MSPRIPAYRSVSRSRAFSAGRVVGLGFAILKGILRGIDDGSGERNAGEPAAAPDIGRIPVFRATMSHQWPLRVSLSFGRRKFFRGGGLLPAEARDGHQAE